MESKRPRIMYLITGLGMGGAEAVLRDMAIALSPDHDIHIVSFGIETSTARELRDRGIRVTSLGIARLRDFAHLFQLFRIIKDDQPDILHTHLFHADMVGRCIGTLIRIPIVSTIHNVQVKNSIRRVLLCLTRSLVTMHVACADIVRSRAIADGIATSKKTVVIHNGIDPQKFSITGKSEARRELSIAPDRILVVCVGSLTKQKGYGYLLDALSMIDKNDRPNVIVLGEGSERAALEYKIEILGLSNVSLRGNVTNVSTYLGAADVFVMPSLWEGFSIALLEAAAVGLSIIATDVGGNRELVTDGVSGTLIPAADARALSGALSEMIKMPASDRERLGMNAREIVLKTFTIDVMADQHRSLYRRFV